MIGILGSPRQAETSLFRGGTFSSTMLMSREDEIRQAYPIDDKLEGWFFCIEETCTGYWEVAGRNLRGDEVSRTAIGDPELALEECINAAIEFEKSG